MLSGTTFIKLLVKESESLVEINGKLEQNKAEKKHSKPKKRLV